MVAVSQVQCCAWVLQEYVLPLRSRTGVEEGGGDAERQKNRHNGDDMQDERNQAADHNAKSSKSRLPITHAPP